MITAAVAASVALLATALNDDKDMSEQCGPVSYLLHVSHEQSDKVPVSLLNQATHTYFQLFQPLICGSKQVGQLLGSCFGVGDKCCFQLS